MSYLDHDGLAYFKSKLDRTFIADIVFDDGDILLYGGDGTLLKTVVQEGTVTQKKSTTNKEYPILLCWDADAEEDQTMKTVWYGLDARINPKFGYLYARRYYTEHPSYERTNAPTARTEWHHIFTDAVSAPMGEVYEYLDRVSDGGEHRMELRLYGNPLSQYVDTPNHNEATDAVSIGVGATKGDKLTFFGYCPSTPIYLENGITMRKSTVRGDQYGKDIITRDWLNLNGSITGLVHTYMDETIDGYKTFLKTVTIDSGNDNAKAGLNVQGDVNIDSGDNTKPSNIYVQGNSHIHGNEDIDGNLNVDGTSTLDGNVHMKHNLDVDGNLNVDGTSDQHGNVHMYSNLDVDGNANTDGNQTIGGTLTVTGKITGNGGAEISGGSGLKVNGNETVTGNLGVGGTINKVSGNTTQEYVTYVTNQADTRKNIAAGLVDTSKGLSYNASTGKIGVNPQANGGLKFDPSTGALFVDFANATDEAKAAVMSALGIQIPLTSNKTFIVNRNHASATDAWRNSAGVIDSTVGTVNKPFQTIQAAIACATQGYAIGSNIVTISVVKGSSPYVGGASLPPFNRTTGGIVIESSDPSNRAVWINNPGSIYGLITCTGTGWSLRNLDLQVTLSKTTDGINHYPMLLSVQSGSVTILGCHFSMSYTGEASTDGSVRATMFQAVTNGVILFQYQEGSQTTITVNKGNSDNMNVFSSERQGYISLISTNLGVDNSAYHKIPCSGTCDVFISCWQQGVFNSLTGSLYPIQFTGSVTGKKCVVRTSSFIALDHECPGSEVGTVDSGTGSWVQPASIITE